MMLSNDGVDSDVREAGASSRTLIYYVSDATSCSAHALWWFPKPFDNENGVVKTTMPSGRDLPIKS